MGKTIKDWVVEIKKMDTIDLIDYKDSIEKLSKWYELKKQYEWTGIFTILVLLKQEIEDRINKKGAK